MRSGAGQWERLGSGPARLVYDFCKGSWKVILRVCTHRRKQADYLKRVPRSSPIQKRWTESSRRGLSVMHRHCRQNKWGA